MFLEKAQILFSGGFNKIRKNKSQIRTLTEQSTLDKKALLNNNGSIKTLKRQIMTQQNNLINKLSWWQLYNSTGAFCWCW